jgi:predicted ribosomally synthesized peptide with nif11-like leader
MTLEELYTKTISDENLKKAFSEAKKEGKIADFLAANGCEASAEDVEKFLASKKDGELSDDELDNVAGGCTTYNNGRPVVTDANVCDLWICENCRVAIVDREAWPANKCKKCGSLVKCGNCYYSKYEDALLQCFHPKRYEN